MLVYVPGGSPLLGWTEVVVIASLQGTGVNSPLDPLVVMPQYLHHLFLGEPPIATAPGYIESLGPDDDGVYAPVHLPGDNPGVE